MMLPLLLSSLAGYLLGAIPVAYLVTRAWGVDIFSVGTGNPGAANTFRSVGRFPGLIVFGLDALKGAAAVLIAGVLGVDVVELRVLAGATAVVGHWYPLFLRFRGGAGLAPSVGVAFGALPLAAAIGGILAVVLLFRFHNTGLAAAAGFAALLIAAALQGETGVAIVVVALAIMVILHTRLWVDRRAARRRTSS
jgi:glycerol-3-phosphate acyltransferase PlsY